MERRRFTAIRMVKFFSLHSQTSCVVLCCIVLCCVGCCVCWGWRRCVWFYIPKLFFSFLFFLSFVFLGFRFYIYCVTMFVFFACVKFIILFHYELFLCFYLFFVPGVLCMYVCMRVVSFCCGFFLFCFVFRRGWGGGSHAVVFLLIFLTFFLFFIFF